MLRNLLLILFFFIPIICFSQPDSGSRTYISGDSVQKANAPILRDSIASHTVLPQKKILSWQEDTAFSSFFQFEKDSEIYMLNEDRAVKSQDELFYIIIALVFFLAFIKITFSKYFQNIFKLFFQSAFRQKQTRENLLQDNLPSLLFNILFVFSTGLFVTLAIVRSNSTTISFWYLLLYSTLILSAIYSFKYLFLKFSGWVFNEREAASTYIFIVFLINKIFSVFLIPVILLLAFSHAEYLSVIITITLFSIAVLLAYRYAVSLSIIRRNLKVKPLHFFIYLCAVELIPLLIIYKVFVKEISSNI
jgi:hypothetical protein